jgi:tRNA (uracil-5-)-methyltransferase
LVNLKTYFYQQIESGFTQPNGFVCEAMLNWAVEHSKNLGNDLLELYCGNGNFTLPLAQNFRRVLATEISKPSTQSAQFNIALIDFDIGLNQKAIEAFEVLLNSNKPTKNEKDFYSF